MKILPHRIRGPVCLIIVCTVAILRWIYCSVVLSVAVNITSTHGIIDSNPPCFTDSMIGVLCTLTRISVSLASHLDERALSVV